MQGMPNYNTDPLLLQYRKLDLPLQRKKVADCMQQFQEVWSESRHSALEPTGDEETSWNIKHSKGST